MTHADPRVPPLPPPLAPPLLQIPNSMSLWHESTTMLPSVSACGGHALQSFVKDFYWHYSLFIFLVYKIIASNNGLLTLSMTHLSDVVQGKSNPRPLVPISPPTPTPAITGGIRRWARGRQLPWTWTRYQMLVPLPPSSPFFLSSSCRIPNEDS